MGRPRADLRALDGVPGPGRLVRRPSGDQLAVGTPGDAVDRARVARERLDQAGWGSLGLVACFGLVLVVALTIGDWVIPEPRGVVTSPREDLFAIGRDRHRQDD